MAKTHLYSCAGCDVLGFTSKMQFCTPTWPHTKRRKKSAFSRLQTDSRAPRCEHWQ